MSNVKKGLRTVAVLEASKGIMALIAGLSIHQLAGKNIEQILDSLLGRLHLNSASHLPRMLLHDANFLNSSNLIFITIGVIIYSVIRLIEAYGLWNELVWTEWFALLSGAIYLPFEVYEVIVHTDVLMILVLSVNIAIVWYMYVLLSKNKSVA